MKTQLRTVTLLLAVGSYWRAPGQTTKVNLSKQGKLETGAVLPVRCTAGQMFFKEDAPSGSNLYACSAADTWTVIGLPALGGDASGTQQSLTVTGLQSRSLSPSVPGDRDVLRWNPVSGQWEPGPVVATGTALPPGTCSAGNLYLQTDPVNDIQQLYICSTTDAWSMASFRSGAAASRPANCVAGQTWLATDTGVLTYCSATGTPGTWSTTTDLGPGTMTRMLPTAVDSTVDIGTFDADTTEASASYEIYASTHGSGGNISKSYKFSIEQNMSSNSWRTVAPLTSTGPDGGQDWDLEVCPSNTTDLELRLRRTAGAGSPTVSITVYRHAGGTYRFTPSSTVSTGVATPSGFLSTSVLTQQDGNAYYNGSLIIPVTGTPAVGYVPTATSATTAAWAAPPGGGGGGTGNAANPVTITFSPTPAFTCGSPTAGTITTFKLSTALTANITSSTLSGCTSGQLLAFILTQDATGGRTFAPPSGFDPVAISPLPNVTTTLLFQWDGSIGRLVNSSNDSGYIYVSAVSSPAAPPSGMGAVYYDSPSKNLAVKDDAGAVKHGVKTDTGAANNYISAIADDGSITKSRPACATLSDSSTGCSKDVSNVTNDIQTKASIVPNTAPSPGQMLVGNAGGTAYAPVTISGSCSMASSGAITCSGTGGLLAGGTDGSGIQKFFGTAAPGSVSGNLPGDFYTDTTNHNVYACNAPAGTAAPACTAVATAGWLKVNSTGGTVVSGSKALATSSISSATCTAAQTATATGTLSTDTVVATFNADPTSVTGYAPAITGMLTILAWPTADTVNFKVCNNTAASITPGAVTLNWRVSR